MKAAFASDLLAGQHIVVTGGGSGLGRAMARRCAALGARVTINGRRPDPLQRVVEEIRADGGAAEGLSCNVREEAEVEAFFTEAEARQGPVTRLVNNAAANFLAATETISANGFDAIIRTNLHGTFYSTQACGKRWIERQEPGVVLSVATTYAATGSAFVVPSAMSKAAIVAMTRSLAVEWGTYGIRLNAVAPGSFPTKGAWERLVPGGQIEEQMRRRIPLERFGDPEELANLAAFLLSDLSAYMTGAVVRLDGGEVLSSGGQLNDLIRMPRGQITALFEMMRPPEKKSAARSGTPDGTPDGKPFPPGPDGEEGAQI